MKILNTRTKRQEQRFERIRERFADKVERITDVAEGLYCKCGAVTENTPSDNLQLISSLSSFGRKKRSSGTGRRSLTHVHSILSELGIDTWIEHLSSLNSIPLAN